MNDQPRELLIAVNGGQADTAAIELALQISANGGTRLTLVYVVEVAQAMPLDAELPSEIDRGETILRQSELIARSTAKAKRTTIVTELLQARSAGGALVEEAWQRQPDAIVMAVAIRAKHGRRSLGSTVDYVLRSAPCEVFLVRQSARVQEQTREGTPLLAVSAR